MFLKRKWRDPYAPEGMVVGRRCPIRYNGDTKSGLDHRCMRLQHHKGQHRWTSGSDGRSVSWE